MQIGTIGIWSGEFRSIGESEVKQHAAILDTLGFHALWIPGGGADAILNAVRSSLEATTSLAVASGILSIWRYAAGEVAAVYQELQASFGDRAVLGLGVSHAPTVNTQTEFTYAQPMRQMREFLDGLDAAGVAADDRILAALGPRMLDLARERSAGAHPYCVPVEHTRAARERLGAGPLLIPEVKVVFEEDPQRARQIARVGLDHYLKLDNYVNNLLRLGWTAAEIADGGCDALVDALAGWGSEEQIRAFIQRHLEAGADHVALHVLTSTPEQFPVAEWGRLAELLADLL